MSFMHKKKIDNIIIEFQVENRFKACSMELIVFIEIILTKWLKIFNN